MANNEVRDTLQALFGDVAPKLADVTQKVVFDDIWQRPELSKRDRSVVTVAALIAMNRAEQLPAHLKRALDNGVTRTELEEIVTHLAFYAGFPCAITAARLTHELYESLDG
jgi:4-carboxymuconolactone decarboxylase